MECRSEIHRLLDLELDSVTRMDLHCFNRKCQLNLNNTRYGYGNFVQVICVANEPWVCNQYGLVIEYGELMYLVSGNRTRRISYISTLNCSQNLSKGIKDPINIFSDKFVDIGTDNEMHERLKKFAVQEIRRAIFK